MKNARLAMSLLSVITSATAVLGQAFVANYDESKVPHYTLPDPLTTQSGDPVTDAKTWNESRREEILESFRGHVFGRSPDAIEVDSRLVTRDDEALGGKAIRRQFDLTLRRGDRELTMELLIHTPKVDGKVPAFLGLNFQGNHATHPDPSIRVPRSWVRPRTDGSTDGNRANEAGRGVDGDAWPVEMIIERGYGLATIYYGDIDPDFDDEFQNGIHALFGDWTGKIAEGERWGSIAGWAYGLSRALDFLETDELIDGSRVAVIGHSRLGKTSLWAGATDPRFKLVISNNSGCGGAALSRRAFGETVGRINSAFPHWFAKNHRLYNENESQLPVDHHELIALIAPRAVYVASATEDRWADPYGEFLSCVHADPVYRLLGTDGFVGAEKLDGSMPPADQPISEGTIGYHLRTGDHAITPVDWRHYLDFADKHL